MTRLLIIFLIVISFTSCRSRKSVNERRGNDTKVTKTETKPLSKVDLIIEDARRFEGVRYKYGGTTKKGMDCSGLIHTAFGGNDIELPRTTKDLSVAGDWVDLKDVKKGDLLFFATKKNSRKVNHVGIVTESRVGYLEFIHSTSSRGVITSLLSERYWYFAFVQARRVL